ncbi:hypothetical protein Tco_0328671 [Tanacetum coccineum]
METKDILSSCSNSEEQQMQQIQDKAKKSCMVSFRQLHSHLKLLSNNDLKGTRTECGFKRAFATLFGQDVETFTGTMFLNMDQLEKQLDKEEFQEIGSMAAFKVLETQFQMFIKSRIYLDDEYVVMTRNYFLQYTQLEIPEFRDTLIQHMESVKKSIDKRALHKREYDSWFANDHVAGNGVGFTQLALFGGGMYFELLVYIPEASTLGFSEAVDPPLFLPRNSVFSLAFSAVKAFSFSVFKFKNFSVFPIACRSKIFAKAIFELGTTISEKANTPDPRYGPSMETNMRHLTSHRCLLGCRTCLVFRYLFNAIPIGENHRPLHYPIMANSDG